MMSKFNIEFVLGVACITFMVGLAVSDVGTMPANKGEPYGWDLPFMIGIIMGGIFFLGYRAGRNNEC
jgi:hypothetical protein